MNFHLNTCKLLNAKTALKEKINDLQLILSDCVLWDKSMISYNSYGDYKVGFGATVTFVNTETNVNKTYTIVSTYETDINNGLISIQAPFVKEMLGLTFNDYLNIMILNMR